MKEEKKKTYPTDFIINEVRETGEVTVYKKSKKSSTINAALATRPSSPKIFGELHTEDILYTSIRRHMKNEVGYIANSILQMLYASYQDIVTEITRGHIVFTIPVNFSRSLPILNENTDIGKWFQMVEATPDCTYEDMKRIGKLCGIPAKMIGPLYLNNTIVQNICKKNISFPKTMSIGKYFENISAYSDIEKGISKARSIGKYFKEFSINSDGEKSRSKGTTFTVVWCYLVELLYAHMISGLSVAGYYYDSACNRYAPFVTDDEVIDDVFYLEKDGVHYDVDKNFIRTKYANGQSTDSVIWNIWDVFRLCQENGMGLSHIKCFIVVPSYIL